MEGVIAAWYAKVSAKSLGEFRDEASRVAMRLRAGDRVLEIAPGPGFLAIELAKLGPYRVSGVDISHSFVRIATENAARAGVAVSFQQGDAAALPLAANTIDFIICRAAFKNFSDPLGAIREMHRVLRPGGTALIIDMRKDASDEEISDQVKKLRVGAINAFVTKIIFKHMLRKRAYSGADFARILAATPFGGGEITDVPFGLEVRLAK
jgi:ubiquinone/menaquinone biosynthesis C-methylase UbiE